MVSNVPRDIFGLEAGRENNLVLQLLVLGAVTLCRALFGRCTNRRLDAEEFL